MIIGMIEVRWWVIKGVHNIMNLLLYWELMPTLQTNHQPERETEQLGKSSTHPHTSLIPLPPSIAQSIPQLHTPHLPTPALSCPFHPSVTHSIPNYPFHPLIPHSIFQSTIPSLNSPFHPSTPHSIPQLPSPSLNFPSSFSIFPKALQDVTGTLL